MHNEITMENTLYVGLGIQYYMFSRGEKTICSLTPREEKKNADYGSTVKT